MHFSILFSLSSVVAFTQASAIAVRNANHIGMYSTGKCHDRNKFYKWKSTDTCACIKLKLGTQSMFTDHEPAQFVYAFSDDECDKRLASTPKGKCASTEGIGSVIF